MLPINIRAPLNGEIVAIESVPDPVFAEHMMGDGVAIAPFGDDDPHATVVVAPVDGILIQIFDTNHAFTMKTAEGVELLIHIGIDTVNLKGEGFSRLFQGEPGQEIRAGEPIVRLDLPYIASKAKSILVPIVLLDMGTLSTIEKMTGGVSAGTSVIMVVKT